MFTSNQATAQAAEFQHSRWPSHHSRHSSGGRSSSTDPLRSTSLAVTTPTGQTVDFHRATMSCVARRRIVVDAVKCSTSFSEASSVAAASSLSQMSDKNSTVQAMYTLSLLSYVSYWSFGLLASSAARLRHDVAVGPKCMSAAVFNKCCCCCCSCRCS